MLKKKIQIRRLTVGTILKLVSVGFLLSIGPFVVLMGVLSLFGFSTVTVDDQAVTGLSGLVTSLFLAASLWLVFTFVFGSFISLGLWLFSRFKPFVIYYYEYERSPVGWIDEGNPTTP